MKIQFLYHPENDKHIADQIIDSADLQQSHSLQGMKIGEINALGEGVFEAIKNCDVLILLIGTTFSKITPIIWMNALQHRNAIVGIDIHTIPDEWGETRKKGGTFDTEGTMEGKKTVKLFEIHELPEGKDGILYIKDNIKTWCQEAIKHVESNYENT